MGAAVAVILLREREIVDAFERAGATNPGRAMSPAELGVDPDGIGWRRLHGRAVVREVVPGAGRYYLDQEVWRGLRGARRRLVVALLILLIVGAVALGVMGPLQQ